MNETITLDGVVYHPIPGYAPLAISRLGACLNMETMQKRKWTCVQNRGVTYQMAHIPKGGDTFGITVQRALALCFIPVPDHLQAIPIEELRAKYASRIHNFEEAIDLALISWELKKKNTAVITNTQTKAVMVCEDFSAASLHLSHNSNLIHGLRMAYGNHFAYKHYQVDIYTRT